MGCVIIVGGQYGSEGKGKALHAFLADPYAPYGVTHDPYLVRVGGPNAGHTHAIDGKDVIFRQVPATDRPDATMLISAGCAIKADVLKQEVELLNHPRPVVVDPRAVVIQPIDDEHELVAAIGSTGSGTGAALARRMLRETLTTLAEDLTNLSDKIVIDRVAPMIHDHLDRNGTVIIEGTQGFGLSLLHSDCYPFVTSRDTTASEFASQAGVSPRQVTDVIMVVRTFPIRVGGNSGPLKDEISWDDVRKLGGNPFLEPEYTSVTNRLRRVGMWDLELVKKAARYNRPTAIALMGLDRLDYGNRGIRKADKLTEKAVVFIHELEDDIQVPVKWVGTGPQVQDIVQLR